MKAPRTISIESAAAIVPNGIARAAFDNTLTYYGVTLRIPGDVNASGIVDILDAAGVSAHWYQDRRLAHLPLIRISISTATD